MGVFLDYLSTPKQAKHSSYVAKKRKRIVTKSAKVCMRGSCVLVVYLFYSELFLLAYQI